MPYSGALGGEGASCGRPKYDEVAEDSVLRLMLSDLAVRRHEPSGAHKTSAPKRRQKRAEGDSHQAYAMRRVQSNRVSMLRVSRFFSTISLV